MLPSYFDYIFVHLRQKAHLRPELSPKFSSTLGPNPKSPARLTTLIVPPAPPLGGPVLELHSRVTESKARNWMSELAKQVQYCELCAT